MGVAHSGLQHFLAQHCEALLETSLAFTYRCGGSAGIEVNYLFLNSFLAPASR